MSDMSEFESPAPPSRSAARTPGLFLVILGTLGLLYAISVPLWSPPLMETFQESIRDEIERAESNPNADPAQVDQLRQLEEQLAESAGAFGSIGSMI